MNVNNISLQYTKIINPSEYYFGNEVYIYNNILFILCPSSTKTDIYISNYDQDKKIWSYPTKFYTTLTGVFNHELVISISGFFLFILNLFENDLLIFTFDPISQSWTKQISIMSLFTAGSNLIIKKYSLSGNLLGIILFDNSYNYYVYTLIFNPIFQSWSQPTLLYYRNDLYIISDIILSGNNLIISTYEFNDLGDVYASIFNSISQSWSQPISIFTNYKPTNYNYIIPIALSENFLVAGFGYDNYLSTDYNRGSVFTSIFDPISKSWSTPILIPGCDDNTLPFQGFFGSKIILSGKILLIVGNSLYSSIFNPLSQSWSQIINLGISYDPSLILTEKYIFYIDNNKTKIYQLVFNSITQSWSQQKILINRTSLNDPIDKNNTNFAYSISLSGNFLVIGCINYYNYSNIGKYSYVYIYNYNLSIYDFTTLINSPAKLLIVGGGGSGGGDNINYLYGGGGCGGQVISGTYNFNVGTNYKINVGLPNNPSSILNNTMTITYISANCGGSGGSINSNYLNYSILPGKGGGGYGGILATTGGLEPNTVTIPQGLTLAQYNQSSQIPVNVGISAIINGITTTNPTYTGIGNIYYFAFTSTSGLNKITIPANFIGCSILIVGGGGSGGIGNYSGGGGAGEVIYNYSYILPSDTYTITVGNTGGFSSIVNSSSSIIFKALSGGNGGYYVQTQPATITGTNNNIYNISGINYYANFLNNGTISFNVNTICTILMVGGGGGGGGGIGAGGGGSGEVIYATNVTLSAGITYTIVIGSGGNVGSSGSSGSKGNDTTITYNTSTTFTASGGGGGGAPNAIGLSSSGYGSSGGGGGNGSKTGGALKIPNPILTDILTGGQIFFNKGGNGNAYNTTYRGGGGGGAGAVGNNATSGSTGTSGSGGAGIQYNITGTNVTYSAGGGGSGITTTPTTPGSGGNGNNSGGINGIVIISYSLTYLSPVSSGSGGGGSGSGIGNTNSAKSLSSSIYPLGSSDYISNGFNGLASSGGDGGSANNIGYNYLGTTYGIGGSGATSTSSPVSKIANTGNGGDGNGGIGASGIVIISFQYSNNNYNNLPTSILGVYNGGNGGGYDYTYNGIIYGKGGLGAGLTSASSTIIPNTGSGGNANGGLGSAGTIIISYNNSTLNNVNIVCIENLINTYNTLLRPTNNIPSNTVTSIGDISTIINNNAPTVPIPISSLNSLSSLNYVYTINS